VLVPTTAVDPKRSLNSSAKTYPRQNTNDETDMRHCCLSSYECCCGMYRGNVDDDMYEVLVILLT